MITLNDMPEDDYWAKLTRFLNKTLTEHLQELKSPKRKDYMSVPQLAEYLNVSQKTIYRNKQLPRVKVGKSFMFDREEIDNWLKVNR
jgi:excisionase family DNA binding protein